MALARHLQKIGAACYSPEAQTYRQPVPAGCCSREQLSPSHLSTFFVVLGPGGVPIAKSSGRASESRRRRPGQHQDGLSLVRHVLCLGRTLRGVLLQEKRTAPCLS